MKYLILLLLLPFTTSAQPTKLDKSGVYETAMREYAKLHPEDATTVGNEKIFFLKAQDYTRGLPDTLSGYRFVFISPDSVAALAQYFPSKKHKLTLLDMRQFFARSNVNFVYIFPTRATWNAKKLTLSAPEYMNRFCRIDFDYRVEAEQLNYYFKESSCETAK